MDPSTTDSDEFHVFDASIFEESGESSSSGNELEDIPAVLPPSVRASLQSRGAHPRQHTASQYYVINDDSNMETDDDVDDHHSLSVREGRQQHSGPGQTKIASDVRQIRIIYSHRIAATEDDTTFEMLYRVFSAVHAPTWERAANVSAKMLETYRANLAKSGPTWAPLYRINSIWSHRQAIVEGSDGGAVELWLWVSFQPCGLVRPGQATKGSQWVPRWHVPADMLDSYLVQTAGVATAEDSKKLAPVPDRLLPQVAPKPAAPPVILHHADILNPGGAVERWFSVEHQSSAADLPSKTTRTWKLAKELPSSLVCDYLGGNKVRVNGPSCDKWPDRLFLHEAPDKRPEAHEADHRLNGEVASLTAQAQGLQRQMNHQLGSRDAHLASDCAPYVRALEAEFRRLQWLNENAMVSRPDMRAARAELERANALAVQVCERQVRLQWQAHNYHGPTVEALQGQNQKLRARLAELHQAVSGLDDVRGRLEQQFQEFTCQLDLRDATISRGAKVQARLEVQVQQLQEQLAHRDAYISELCEQLCSMRFAGEAAGIWKRGPDQEEAGEEHAGDCPCSDCDDERITNHAPFQFSLSPEPADSRTIQPFTFYPSQR